LRRTIEAQKIKAHARRAGYGCFLLCVTVTVTVTQLSSPPDRAHVADAVGMAPAQMETIRYDSTTTSVAILYQFQGRAQWPHG
jgi:hypothetical protein